MVKKGHPASQGGGVSQVVRKEDVETMLEETAKLPT